MEVRVETRNRSKRGLGIVSETPIEAGRRVAVTLPDSHKPVVGRVLHSKPDGSGRNAIGVQLETTDSE